MDATEFQLRRMIKELEDKIQELEDNFEEKVRRILVSYGVIEGAAEDE